MDLFSDLPMKTISPWQFTLFRILFGAYLAFHFAALVPFAGELFGSGGLIPDAALNPTAGLFPNPLALDVPEWGLVAALAFLTTASLCFAAGFARVPVAVALWFGWTALFHRNNLISNPGIPYVGLLLLLSALVPGGEPLSHRPRREDWAMPAWVWRCAWILLAAGYTFSGWTKLSSPSWTDGSALRFLLENPLARPGVLRDLMLALPEPLLQAMTWGTLLVELLFAPLALWRRSRPWIWLSMVLMHLGIVAVVDFADLTLGMLMIHLFTFDPDWIRPRREVRVMAYDGGCLMCSKTVRFFAGEDRHDLIRFVTLQSAAGRAMEAEAGTERLESVLVRHGERTFARSAAVVELLAALGGHWAVLGFSLGLVPRRLRDGAYRLVAKRRHRRGGGDACSLPTEAVRSRLL